MAAEITLYSDAQLIQRLTDGTWTVPVDLGTTTIPGSGSTNSISTAVYGKNTGTTTIQDIYIAPIAGGGVNGTAFVADIQIAPDLTGAAGTYGIQAAQVLVYSGNLSVARPKPTSNSSTNIANPSVAPTLSTGALSSNLPAGAYTVGYSFKNSIGETLLSPTANITITAGQSIRISAISLITNATGVNYYMSFVAGDTTGLFYSNTNNGGTNIDLVVAQGFFRFWVRQNVDSSDAPGTRQAKLQLDATNIG